MAESRREQAAVARWKPGRRWYYPLLAAATINLSRFILHRLNSLTIEGEERFDALRERGGRGLLTYSNHVSLFDDPLLPSCFKIGGWETVRWVATDAINFFGSRPKAWLFTAGKGVPVVRGSGATQPGLGFLADRLREGAWVHIFPEGGRTRDPQGLMTPAFKPGIGRLMEEARPLALPFYHHGMREVLPIGALRPRRGKTVRLLFGEVFDSADDLRELAAGDGAIDHRALWEALAARAHGRLRRLEMRLHPAAEPARSDVAV
jgi:1-acyl-sn-glycerol-3-phosphate acyltransferase